MRLQGHHSPPEAKPAAGHRAKPAPARAQAVPKRKTAAQLARSERDRERLRQKHLARVAKVLPRLQAWLRRARASLEQRMELTLPEPPTGPSAAAPPPPPAMAAEAQPSATPLAALGQRYTALWLTVRIASRLMALRHRARLRRRFGLELRDHPKYGVRFGGNGRFTQAEKVEVNAKAAFLGAAEARHRALSLPATQLAPSRGRAAPPSATPSPTPPPAPLPTPRRPVRWAPYRPSSPPPPPRSRRTPSR